MELINNPFSTAVLGFFMGIICVILFNIAKKEAGKQCQNSPKSNFSPAEVEGLDETTIFDDNFFGLAFFDEQNKCLYVNYLFLGLFSIANKESVPDLDEILSKYGDANGMNSAFLMGNRQYSVVIEKDKLFLQLEYRRFKKGNNSYTSLIASDVTEKEQRQEHARQFVANVSHELKTPLTTIKSYSESLLDWGIMEKDKDKITKDVKRIFEDALRMERLVNDLSLLTSIDSRGIKPLMQELNIVPLVKSLIDRVHHEAAKKDIEIEFKVLSKIPLIFAEKSSVERIISNLLSNAIKYTHKSGYVGVFINAGQEEIYIKVSDTGIGIDKKHISKIFDRFYRVDKTGSVLYGGTGLGLSIAQDLALLHEGRLEVKSELNKGSDFFLFLPTANKVYHDVLTAYADLHQLKGELYEQAGRNLLEKCKEIIPYKTSLSGITQDEIELLCKGVKNVKL